MTQNRFFRAESIAGGVRAITGPGTELCYLVEGSETALLIDTLSGVGNLKSFCETLTELPITVVNTHGHVDHCGGNMDFGTCYINPLDIEGMYKHMAVSIRKGHVEMMQAMSPEPITFSDDDMAKPGPLYTIPVYDGDVFDLGDRQIQVIAVPGHSLGTIVLLDETSRIVFSGDACNVNTLVIFYPDSTTIETYLSSLARLKSFESKFDVLYGGHGLVAVPKVIVDEAMTLCSEIMDGKDDQVASEFLGRKCYYAKKMENYRRLDGKLANIAYTRESVFEPPEKPVRVIR